MQPWGLNRGTMTMEVCREQVHLEGRARTAEGQGQKSGVGLPACLPASPTSLPHSCDSGESLSKSQFLHPENGDSNKANTVGSCSEDLKVGGVHAKGSVFPTSEVIHVTEAVIDGNLPGAMGWVSPVLRMSVPTRILQG